MTSIEPVVRQPLPPLKVGDKVSVKLRAVNKNGMQGVARLEGTWLIQVDHASDKAALVADETIDVMITKLFPGGAEGVQV
jgi:predicted RNA-binding protein with TRAM domain